MKYLILLISLVPCSALAQFSKGDKMLGGSLQIRNMRSIDYTDPTPISTVYSGNDLYLSIQPELGFFLSNRFVLGGQVGYDGIYRRNTSRRTTGTSTFRSATHAVSIGLLFRRYFAITDKFFFALDGIPFCQIHDGYTLGARIRPILTYLPTENWGFEGGIGTLDYRYTNIIEPGEANHSFNFRLGGISLGVRYYMRKKIE